MAINMKHRIRYYLIINIISPLIIGSMIYLLFRTDDLIVYKWIDIISYESSIPYNFMQDSFVEYVPSWIRFCLADGIWIYVFTSSIFLIWSHKLNVFWLMTPLVIGIGLELSQLYEYIPGTFDYADLFILVLAHILAIKSGLRWRNKCTET